MITGVYEHLYLFLKPRSSCLAIYSWWVPKMVLSGREVMTIVILGQAENLLNPRQK